MFGYGLQEPSALVVSQQTLPTGTSLKKGLVMIQFELSTPPLPHSEGDFQSPGHSLGSNGLMNTNIITTSTTIAIATDIIMFMVISAFLFLNMFSLQ